jgi:hypothetical protein
MLSTYEFKSPTEVSSGNWGKKIANKISSGTRDANEVSQDDWQSNAAKHVTKGIGKAVKSAPKEVGGADEISAGQWGKTVSKGLKSAIDN